MGDSMSNIAEQLGKLGVNAGPSVSCDARPATSKRQAPTFQRCKPVAVKQLYEDKGNIKAAEMLGVSPSGLSTMISRDDVSVTIEKLAEMIILNGGQTLNRQKTRIIVVRVPADKAEVVSTFHAALGLKSMSVAE